ncbi:MAG: ABC transporter ATP-binding protein [Phycisphaerae bacterium]|nr:ABC transporter ATP-binding protein [Phycisphaerae bacterium]
MIRIVDVWHHYGIQPVLKDISLTIETGHVVAVMGPNGMGKSTLLALVGGILHPLKGHIEIDGQIRRSSVEAEKSIRRKLVYLPAEPYLPLDRTGRELITSVGRLYDVEDRSLIEHAERLLRLFNLGEKGDAPIRTYSTGQRKKIAICSALITRVPILVLDEPFSGGLDSAALLVLGRILKYLASRTDVTILMAVPVPELVESLADKIDVIDKGRITAFDSPENLRKQTGVGTLTEALERSIHPEIIRDVEEYLAGERP